MGNKDIYSIPLPKECSTWEVSGTELYGVKGIEEEYYQDLNMSFVRKIPKGFEVKRRVVDKAKRSYKQNADGSYVYEDYKVPSGSIIVTSGKNINLPYKKYVKPENGYGYIDYIESKNGIEYMYVLPKSVLYRVHQTALAISVKNMKNYSGMGYLTWNKGVIYVHVIPYSPNSQYSGSRILKTGMYTDYSKDILRISSYWESIKLIPSIKLCALQTGENLCLKPTVVGYDSYTPIEPIPISDKEVFGSEGVSNNESGKGTTK